MAITILPIFASANDYQRLLALVPDDPNLPDCFDAWRELVSKEIAKAARTGGIVQEVPADPDEFARYCDLAGLDRNYVTLFAFAAAKARGQKY